MIDDLITAIENGLRETNGRSLMDANKVQNLLLDVYNEAIKLRVPAEPVEELMPVG